MKDKHGTELQVRDRVQVDRDGPLEAFDGYVRKLSGDGTEVMVTDTEDDNWFRGAWVGPNKIAKL